MLLEPDLPDHIGPAGHHDRIAKRVEKAKIDASAMREDLLVKRDGARLVPKQVKRSVFTRHDENRNSGLALRLLVGGLVLERAAALTVSCSRRPAAQSAATFGIRACSGAALVKYSALTISNGHRLIGAANVNRQATLR